MSILDIGTIVLGVIDRIFPNKNEITKADMELKKAIISAEVQIKLAEAGLLTKQADTNTAEAANPNRTWITWREMIGYACACALWYSWILQPAVTFMFAASGNPLDPKVLPELDIFGIMAIVGGMLGIPLTQYISQKVTKK
jgi:hypothetical protein